MYLVWGLLKTKMKLAFNISCGTSNSKLHLSLSNGYVRGKIVVKHILVIMIVIFEITIFIFYVLKRKEKGHQKNILIFNSVFQIFQFSFKMIRNYYYTTTQIIIETHEFKLCRVQFQIPNHSSRLHETFFLPSYNI